MKMNLAESLHYYSDKVFNSSTSLLFTSKIWILTAIFINNKFTTVMPWFFSIRMLHSEFLYKPQKTIV